MKKAIITGATGYIGKNLAIKLLNENKEVYIVVRNKIKAKKIFEDYPEINIVECQLDKISELFDVFSEKKIDTFYHFAWEGVASNKRSSYKEQLKSVALTCRCIEFADSINCNKFIFAGSIMEYEYKKI